MTTRIVIDGFCDRSQSNNLGNSSVDVMENIKKAFDENEISLPYPQRDVHLFNHNE